MSFNNKNLFITLLSLCTFQTYAAQCTAETFAKNKLNNFILVSQQTRTGIPKSVSITIDSPDGYLRTSVQSNFSQCGELIGGRMKEVKTSTGQKTVFTTTSEVQLNKTEFGWRIQLDSNGVIADKNSQETTQVYRQTLEGMYQLNDKGIISRAVSRSVIAATKPEDKDKTALSTIDYAFNSSGLLASAASKGSMAIDNNTTVYSYDGNHRLIKTQSPSTIEEYGYDDEGRELTLSKTQTYFTIEKKLSTCEEWNSHGECTHANMDITITPIDRTGKQYVDKHNAVMTAKYEYWN
jgi:YD repeat-containing protein